ncbi:TPA: Ig domain-containing protein [Clostridium botulinum]|nr:Ig domain-containing protein [Clostridium botulinum]
MKKKIGLIMSMVLLFVFVFSGINNTYVAHAKKNNDFVIGTHNLNNTPQNSAKVGNTLKEPENGWKRFSASNSNIEYIGQWYYTEADYGNYSVDPKSKLRFSFTGNKIRIIGDYRTGYRSNDVTIKIDGELFSYSQIGNTDLTYKCILFEKYLDSKQHYVEIYCNHVNNANIAYCLYAIDIDKNGELKPYEETTKVESISLDKTSMDLLEGSSDKLNAKVLPEDATNKKVVWSSSDEKIAKVDENGKVTAIKEGQATITAKVEGTDLTATCKVNVTKKVEENKNNAILSISLVNGATKEYDVSMQEVEKFINWFEERSNGKGPSLYSFNKKINPYKTVKEYIVHDKIASFEVREYEGNNK